MGTKSNPGAFDCYHNAEPDEPMFILLARDITAASLVERWAKHRDDLIQRGIKPESDRPMIVEALECAAAMRVWRAQNRPAAPMPSCRLPGGECKHYVKCDMMDGCWLEQHPEADAA